MIRGLEVCKTCPMETAETDGVVQPGEEMMQGELTAPSSMKRRLIKNGKIAFCTGI